MSSPSHYAPSTTSTSTPRARSASGGRNAILIPSWLPVVSGDKAAGDIPQCAKLTYRKYGKMEPIALTTVLRQVTRIPNLAKLLVDPIQPKAAGHPLPHRARQGVGMFWTLALEKGQLTVEGRLRFQFSPGLIRKRLGKSPSSVRTLRWMESGRELIMVRGLNECVHLPSRISLQSTSPIRD